MIWRILSFCKEFVDGASSTSSWKQSANLHALEDVLDKMTKVEIFYSFIYLFTFQSR